ncbi:MAG: class I SAM-dependent methyltransferase [Cytophagia bacterium]|nr:class I SAM-dependent methyltransferase [Cytophagia bacterium]
MLEYSVQVVQCSNCEHIYSQIRTDINYDQFYSEGKYVLQDNRGSFFDRVIQFNNRLIGKKVLKFTPNKERILDFGCGKGQFLFYFKSKSWKAVGVETSQGRAEFARREYELEIHEDFYENGQIADGDYAVITLFHVLEHLPNPEGLLENLVRHNLNKNGLIVFEVPLIESWQSKIAAHRWIHLDPPIHLSHYSRGSLFQLIGKLRLTPIRVSTFSAPLGILGMCQSLLSRLGYRGKIIEDLKFNRTSKLLVSLVFVFPLAVTLEFFAVLFKKGGIIRVYCKNTLSEISND